jgi:hypothetical protein
MGYTVREEGTQEEEGAAMLTTTPPTLHGRNREREGNLKLECGLCAYCRGANKVILDTILERHYKYKHMSKAIVLGVPEFCDPCEYVL